MIDGNFVILSVEDKGDPDLEHNYSSLRNHCFKRETLCF